MNQLLLIQQLQRLKDYEFEYLYDHAALAGCFDDLPENDTSSEVILLSQAITEDKDVFDEALNFINIADDDTANIKN